MSVSNSTPTYGAVNYFMIIFALGTYFTFASVQGDFGLFRRIQITAEAEALTIERDQLRVEAALMRKKARRLSDDFLDLDLLDEQARDVLGLVRMDEVVIR